MVTVVVLVIAVVASFVWTSDLIHSAISTLQARRTSPAVVPSGTGGSTANQASRTALLTEVHGGVWTVSTLDANGSPSRGSAFAVVSTSSQTLLVTSYSVVAAATYQPAPPVEVHQGGGPDQPVTLRTWDPQHDLALLVLNAGNEPVLQGTGDVPPVPGQQVYRVSGTGGPVGAVTPGKLITVSAAAVTDDLPPDGPSRGGPVVDASGNVLAVASSAYLPTGSAPPGALVAVPIQDVCVEVLVCPTGFFP